MQRNSVISKHLLGFALLYPAYGPAHVTHSHTGTGSIAWSSGSSMKNADMKHSEERQSLSDQGIQSIDLNPTHVQSSTVAKPPITGQSDIKGLVATYSSQ